MLLHLKNVLTAAQVTEIREALDQADWQDGKLTAGNASRQQKSNLQLSQDDPLARKLGDFILHTLSQREDFMGSALPAKIFPPMFNRYEGGGQFGFHVDNAIRQVPNTPVKVRTDLSMTLFLSEPEDYEGGELVIEDTFGTQAIKLPAGDMVLYPSTSIHKVNPVTQGARVSSFFWLQSLVADNEQRRTLYQLDQSIQGLRQDLPDDERIQNLIWVYHNLLRQWSQTN
ncbi:Fe2+-dependent dioxygenase [Marinomonas ostreistagni]|uniref:Fe2+-dependent dioxygenase n=1 Tax=Marinomonas ostreistagni TaxID=359209 RepID=UPI00195007AD|nr:Fe2+-dependent dioxygenase [Marinomonas ostreistagni]MBM6550957.1 Fe2+-dependent dioxygenase [Marinomonas ostreistagni]